MYLQFRHHTAAFRGRFKYAATKCWNNIPPPLKSLSIISSFKLQPKWNLMQIQLALAPAFSPTSYHFRILYTCLIEIILVARGPAAYGPYRCVEVFARLPTAGVTELDAGVGGHVGSATSMLISWKTFRFLVRATLRFFSRDTFVTKLEQLQEKEVRVD
ncbi:hypothetical protein EVAR_58901_1 [Eumeta japonica]|uniref:Uncharacterized protein n=1 Tax=Eumeta variegata TaxID=151549 RepID=A0A4C1Z0D6_EUMVA|nr:hypothetical protein EVAR_58901_1 [Eumeta japonica]